MSHRSASQTEIYGLPQQSLMCFHISGSFSEVFSGTFMTISNIVPRFSRAVWNKVKKQEQLTIRNYRFKNQIHVT